MTAKCLVGRRPDWQSIVSANNLTCENRIRRARRQKQAQANQQIDQQIDQQSAQSQQYSQTQIENFKKAFSVCLEAKDYMVKF